MRKNESASAMILAKNDHKLGQRLRQVRKTYAQNKNIKHTHKERVRGEKCRKKGGCKICQEGRPIPAGPARHAVLYLALLAPRLIPRRGLHLPPGRREVGRQLLVLIPLRPWRGKMCQPNAKKKSVILEKLYLCGIFFNRNGKNDCFCDSVAILTLSGKAVGKQKNYFGPISILENIRIQPLKHETSLELSLEPGKRPL